MTVWGIGELRMGEMVWEEVEGAGHGLPQQYYLTTKQQRQLARAAAQHIGSKPVRAITPLLHCHH